MRVQGSVASKHNILPWYKKANWRANRVLREVEGNLTSTIWLVSFVSTLSMKHQLVSHSSFHTWLNGIRYVLIDGWLPHIFLKK